jgi:uncharacterized membrane protein YfcA
VAHLHNRPRKHPLNKDYEQMGRQLESLYEAVQPERRALFWTAFWTGVFKGVGGVIGATIVVALLLWLLSLFSELPLVGDFMDSLRGTIEPGSK